PHRDPPVRPDPARPDPAGRVAPPVRQPVPEQPPRAPAPKPENPLPDEIIPSRITDSILMATRGGSPAERHHGLLGMFDFEDQVRREAATSGFIPDVRAELAATKKTETVAAMFGTISRHMERMQQLLISEVADGDLAAQIMERAAPMRPTILPHEAGEDEVRSRMAGLEQTLEKSLRGSA
ncbi:MAG: hypothetical protein KC466_20600, partial [Myxococcales bacterium]|nr:hypothetical protein [Myxococcales bacterium]